MAKDKKGKGKGKKKTKKYAVPPQPPKVDPRLFDLVGSFLREAGLESTARIFEAEIATRKLDKSSAFPKPPSLHEALIAWEKSGVKTAAADEDSGNESEDESSDSEEDTPAASESEDMEMKDDSSNTLSDSEKMAEKAKEQRTGKEAKKTKKKDDGKDR